ncbi:hypothetical protein DNTS_026465, partial [Danionella cerebrum]
MDDTAQGTRLVSNYGILNLAGQHNRSSVDPTLIKFKSPRFPPGESYDSLELKRQKMEEIHLHEGLTGAERGDVCKLMEADEFAAPSDIQQSLHLPESQSLSNWRWMLSMESHVVCEGAQPNFVSGLAALFSTFYNFNLQYQEVAACTLELELFR